jgi:cell division protein FtsX
MDAPGAPAHRRRRIVPIALGVIVLLMVGLVVSLAVSRTTTGPQQVDIFLSPSASPQQVLSVKERAVAMHGVQGCTFWSQERDYREALQLLPASVSADLVPREMPSSWRCQYTPLATLDAISGQLDGVAGVYEVAGPRVNLTPH